MPITFPSVLSAIEAAYQQALQQAKPMVANKPILQAVANTITSRHGQYADKAKRREYMRKFMAAKRAKAKEAQHV